MLIRIFLIAFFCSFLSTVPAQIRELHITKGCSFDDEMHDEDLYTYDPSNEAGRIVAEIVDALGATQNFTVKASNIANAMATTLPTGERFILYSTDFLEKFKADANTQWAAYSVLAHEIGHHINGHTLLVQRTPRERRLLELEADQFSGSVLRMLGASIDEAQAGINTLRLEGESSTHPAKSARLAAASAGWKKRDEWLKERGMTVTKKVTREPSKVFVPTVDNKKLAEDWYNKAMAETDNNKIIEYCTEAIKFNAQYAGAYNLRGVAKLNQSDYNDAILDFNKCIQLEPANKYAYCNRGISKHSLSKYDDAILDFNKSLEIDRKYAKAYSMLGASYYALSNYKEAVVNCSSAIALDINLKNPYYNRGLSYSYFKKYEEALQDFNNFIRLDPNDADGYAQKGCTLVKMERYGEAIDVLNKALKINGNVDFAKDCKAEALKALNKD
jgi:tetratricopeptide (TPR) repeat protein